ncbi:MAG: hypothetical protein ACI4JD_05105 [Ruminococcus sp.]
MKIKINKKAAVIVAIPAAAAVVLGYMAAIKSTPLKYEFSKTMSLTAVTGEAPVNISDSVIESFCANSTVYTTVNLDKLNIKWEGLTITPESPVQIPAAGNVKYSLEAIPERKGRANSAGSEKIADYQDYTVTPAAPDATGIFGCITECRVYSDGYIEIVTSAVDNTAQIPEEVSMKLLYSKN